MDKQEDNFEDENKIQPAEHDADEPKKEADETAEKKADEPKREGTADFTTPMNDPDLLVGAYKPKEGEPPTIKCPNCGEEMPTTIDTCVNCGHYLKASEARYKPMDEKKQRKIRLIVGIVLVVAFVVYMVIRSVV